MPGIEFNKLKTFPTISTTEITWTYRNGIWSYWTISWHNLVKTNV
jgi:hypothetical protein